MPPKVKFKKEAIIDAAFNVVRKNGWQELSARSIARELNSSTGPIYSHLDSMNNLEEEVIQKAMALFMEHIIKPRTGDKWIDHGIGYVFFARDEKHLFKAINDEKRVPLLKKSSLKIWEKLGEELSGYPLFRDLPAGTGLKIRRARWIFIHGLASLITNSFQFDRIKTDEDLIELIRNASILLYRGMKNSPELADDSQNLELNGEYIYE
ncbi:MAG: TetR/AcrR family transcriptional regulator [Deltaproteobacteria bacterium]|nr:TetR/AcrR family transcriptional regulator [Deltaproteobacteria bacterium]